MALGFPQGITYDPAGNIVFAETSANVIRRICRDGILETIAGTGETGFSEDGVAAVQARLNYPIHPRYDAAGNLFVAEIANSRVRRVDTRGVMTTVAGTGIPLREGMDLEGPALSRSIGSIAGLAVGATGVVYFSEPETGAIRRVSEAGSR